MALEFIAKKGATGIPLKAVLKDENGRVNLTGCAVTLILCNAGTKTVKVNGSCDVHNDQVNHRGEVTYSWTDPDLDTVGTYDAEFLVELEDGSYVRFPTSRSRPFGKVIVLDTKTDNPV